MPESPRPPQRRTKIVATIGPATQSPETLARLIEQGVDVVRLNFSHGSQREHGDTILETRRIAKKLGKPVAILQDLQGPRLRVGNFTEGSVRLAPGQTFTLTTREVPGSDTGVSVTYPDLANEVRPGIRVLLDDGRLRLRVIRVKDRDIECRVEVGGILRDHKGINVPEVRSRAVALTAKDLEDLEFTAGLGIDYVALNFVRDPEDATILRTELERLGHRAGIIAKIEKNEAVQAIDAVLRAFDGVMIARGDLGVEIGAERVPLLQKAIIKRANELDKVVITATQMLESMVSSSTPTRAEASDVANAILDGTDAVMLSAETSIGQYPLEAVEIMDRIAKEADAVAVEHNRPIMRQTGHAVVRAAHTIAAELDARAVIVLTNSGRTAHLLAKHRPQMPAFAFTEHEHVYNHLALWWGIVPVLVPFADTVDTTLSYVDEVMLGFGVVEHGDRVLVVGSIPFTARGRTNFLKVHRISPPVTTGDGQTGGEDES